MFSMASFTRMITLPNTMSTILVISTKTMSSMTTTKATMRTTMTSFIRFMDKAYCVLHVRYFDIFYILFLYDLIFFFYWIIFLVQIVKHKMLPLLILNSHSISQLPCSLKVSAFPGRYHFSLTGCRLYITIGFSLFSFTSFFLPLFCTF